MRTSDFLRAQGALRPSLGAFKMPLTPRQRTLSRDLLEMEQLKKDSSILTFDAEGKYPDRYVIHFKGNSLVYKDDEVVIGKHQEIVLTMGMEYPRALPQVRWVTQIVHPNIFSGGVCFGNFSNRWTPYFHLVDLLEILWDYSRLAILNPHSAGQHARNEAESWANLDKKFPFPVDDRRLRDKLMGNNEGSSAVRPEGASDDIVIIPDDEGACQK